MEAKENWNISSHDMVSVKGNYSEENATYLPIGIYPACVAT